MADDVEHLVLQVIADEVGTYPPEAYAFVLEGIGHTVKALSRDKASGEARHVSGVELSWGLRDFALERWGSLARLVLAHWGVHTTDDFGRIVYTLIEYSVASKTQEDRIEDFHRVYDFAEVFA